MQALDLGPVGPPTPDDTISTEELLLLANIVREAGGGDAIEALLPSVPQDASQCLIAKNLNFECEIGPVSDAGQYSDRLWAMKVADKDVAARIAERLGLPIYWKPVFEDWRGFQVSFENDAHVSNEYPLHSLQPNILLPAKVAGLAQAFDDAGDDAPWHRNDMFAGLIDEDYDEDHWDVEDDPEYDDPDW